MNAFGGIASPKSGIAARPRKLPWVNSTIRVTRERWRNWSGELHSQPRRLYSDDAGGDWKSPRTLSDLQGIVRDARAEKVSVRAFGSSHSWAALVPNDDGYVVDNRMINTEDGQFNLSLEPLCADTGAKARATVPPGVLSREFELWLWDQGYSLPASAVEDCFTIGGMVATATHGVGLDIATLSDMVVGMTFVDGNGDVRRWSRESCTVDELSAIQCGLGCMGLIYDITLEVEPRYEVLHEAKLIVYDDYFADTDDARSNLLELHESHTSVEFFWWPFRFSGVPLVSRPEINPDVWVLTTQKTIPEDAKPRSRWKRFLHMQVLDISCMIFAGLIDKLVARVPKLSFAHTWLCCFSNIWVIARCGKARLSQYDANHFINATGVEFMPAQACEWSVPFQRDAGAIGREGYERVRQSFALLHDLVVDAFHSYPLSDPRSAPIVLAIEMRTLAASSALLSPGYQPDELRSDVHYSAPELVTAASQPAWEEFAIRANNLMTTSTAELGTQVRSHQAKACQEWTHSEYPVGGMRAYLRDQYKDAGCWERFLAVRADIDPQGLFLNDYLRAWFEADKEALVDQESSYVEHAA